MKINKIFRVNYNEYKQKNPYPNDIGPIFGTNHYFCGIDSRH